MRLRPINRDESAPLPFREQRGPCFFLTTKADPSPRLQIRDDIVGVFSISQLMFYRVKDTGRSRLGKAFGKGPRIGAQKEGKRLPMRG
jgi:hypothetical protein